MSKERGIDISYWQGDIDFKKVKMDEEIKFVILREGYRQTVDKKFMDYVFGCRTWGIPIHGVYHFIYMMNDRVTSNAETGRLNAESCLRNIQNEMCIRDSHSRLSCMAREKSCYWWTDGKIVTRL